MLDHGFAQYASYTPYLDPELLRPLPVLRGVVSTVEIEAGTMTPLLVKKGEEKRIVCEVTVAEDVEAPVAAGQIVGTLAVKKDGEVLCEYPLVAKCEVRRLKFGDVFGRLWGTLCA
jgi:D-alanyl-D-alanine carboxypeptidase (penicillin-binding protein 5/6)